MKGEGSKIETALINGDKDYNEEKEFQRASKVISHWINLIFKKKENQN